MLNNKIIYQIYPKSFYDSNGDGIGDIQGIIEKLDYLKSLNIDYLWLSPINQSPQHDHGYDISDYDVIDPIYGDLDDYRLLIKEAQRRGIKIMMDLVLNHTSIEHEWFKQAVNGDNFYQHFYYFKKKPTKIQSVFGGPAWSYVRELDHYYFCFFDKTQADLNWENPHVRQALFKMINRWLDIGVEGFRLDVIEHIGKDLERDIHSKGPTFIRHLQELNQATFKNHYLTVGECWSASYEDMKSICNKKGLTQAFHFEDITHTHTGKDKWDQSPFNLNKLALILERWHNQTDWIPAWAMNNHDLPRLISLWLDDQQYRYQSATLLISLYGLLRGNLYIYQGEEIGMTNAYFDEIHLYRDVETLNAYQAMIDQGLTNETAMAKIKRISRDNARTPFQWNQKQYAGFSSHQPWIHVNPNYLQINLETDLSSSQSIFKYYQAILRYRKTHSEIIDQHAIFKVHGSILAIKRKGLTVVGNFSDRSVDYAMSGQILFNNYPDFNQVLHPYQVIVSSD